MSQQTFVPLCVNGRPASWSVAIFSTHHYGQGKIKPFLHFLYGTMLTLTCGLSIYWKNPSYSLIVGLVSVHCCLYRYSRMLADKLTVAREIRHQDNWDWYWDLASPWSREGPGHFAWGSAFLRNIASTLACPTVFGQLPQTPSTAQWTLIVLFKWIASISPRG